MNEGSPKPLVISVDAVALIVGIVIGAGIFLLAGIAFFVLRKKDAAINRPFRVPLFPLPPILFFVRPAKPSTN